MKNINEIMDMLDWNNSLATQEEGRALAEEVQCLKIFMQPCDLKYNKNVWENCALILYKKSDELLQPYLYDLLSWLQDLNWPGAIIILDRLKKFQSYDTLAFAILECLKVAISTKDSLWLIGLSKVFLLDELSNYLDEDILLSIKEQIEI